MILRDVCDLAHDIRSGDPLTIDDGSKAAIPGCENNAVAECAEIEVASRAGVENSVIGQHHRDRRIELPESAQHPVLSHRLVVTRNSHHGEELLGDVDLPFAMDALIFPVRDNVPFRLGAGEHLFHVAPTDPLQRFSRQDVHMPGLGVHGRWRALGYSDDLFDHVARHRLGPEATHTSARVD